ALRPSISTQRNAMAAIDPLTAGAVFIATAATDAGYVMVPSAVIARKRVPAANWSAVWYLLSSYAVISYTENAFYVAFAALGSWAGAYVSLTYLHPRPRRRGRRRSEVVAVLAIQHGVIIRLVRTCALGRIIQYSRDARDRTETP